MFKQMTLAFLIALLPIQSWAVLDMSFKKEASLFMNASNTLQDNHHPCHQELSLNSDEHNVQSNQPSCNACSLCMAFGAVLITNPILRFESPAQSFLTHLSGFSSEDPVLGNKPPIL